MIEVMESQGAAYRLLKTRMHEHMAKLGELYLDDRSVEPEQASKLLVGKVLSWVRAAQS